MPNRLNLAIVIFLLTKSVFAQTTYPINYFRCPIDSTLTLAGNYGEIRPNHFHAGFDIRTNNQVGMPVYAVADGFVSRIKIAPNGYGNCLYIDHPNGFTSVYGHLQNFSYTIATVEKNIQRNKESFEIDTLLPSTLLPVKKGDLIALSGNTGSSQGPHLHFEIRETKSESPVNPYCFGYKVIDFRKPVMTKLAIYPLGENATINGKHQTKKIRPFYKNGVFTYNTSDTITVNGSIGFGVECYDSETGFSQNAVFSVELQSGGKRIYYHEMEKFTFENSRYVNAHIDFPEKQEHGYRIQKCYLCKNNQTGIYKDVINNGIIDFNDDSVHWIRYILKDYAGNTTELMLKVRSRSKSKFKELVVSSNALILDCFKDNIFKKDDIEITIPAYSLYDDIKFNYYRSPKVRDGYSMVHHVQDMETAIQKAITVRIKADNLPERLQSKAAIVSVFPKWSVYVGGTYSNGWVEGQTRDFGNYEIIVDTIPPYIVPRFRAYNKTNINFKKAKTIGFRVSDNLSGVKKYHATIDGNWVLFEYDLKRSYIYYTFDTTIAEGTHVFNIDVADDKGNTSSWKCTFVR